MSSELVRPYGDLIAQEASLAEYFARERAKTVVGPMMETVRQALEVAGVTYDDLSTQAVHEKRNRDAIISFVRTLPSSRDTSTKNQNMRQKLRYPINSIASCFPATDYSAYFSTNDVNIAQGLIYGNSMMWLEEKAHRQRECNYDDPGHRIVSTIKPYYIVGEKHDEDSRTKHGLFSRIGHVASSYLLSPVRGTATGNRQSKGNLILVELRGDKARSAQQLLEDNGRHMSPEDMSQLFDRKTGRFILEPDAFTQSPRFSPGNIKGSLEYMTDHMLLGLKVLPQLAKLASTFSAQKALEAQLAKITAKVTD